MTDRGTSVRSVAPWRSALLVGGLSLLLLPVSLHAADSPSSDLGAFQRLDPNNPANTVPIAREAMKVGCVYEHFSPTLNRRVWSYLQSDRTFWRAFGPGTTIEAARFDLNISRERGLQIIEARDSDLARELVSQGRRVFLRLDDRGRWNLARTASFATMYNVESGERWEAAGAVFLPIVNLCGNNWLWKDGQYVRPY